MPKNFTFWKDKHAEDQNRSQLSMSRKVCRGESFEDALPSGYEYADYDVTFDNKWVQLINESNDFLSLGIWTKETLYEVMIEQLLPRGSVLVIRGGELVACAGLCRYAHSAKIAVMMYFLVHHDHRGQGLSHAMIQKVLQYCKNNGFRAISLLTDDYRLAAIKVYLREGFLPVDQNSIESEEKWRKVFEQLK